MNMHEADITAKFRRYLARRTMPRRIEGNDTAIRDEVAALVNVIRRNCPATPDGLAAWWEGFEARLGETGTGGLWPTEKECRDAASNWNKERPANARKAQSDEELEDERLKKIGALMEEGQPVGDGYLWGRDACELIHRRLVTREVMTGYRSKLFFRHCDVYGEDAALAWEERMKAKHEDAKAQVLRPGLRPSQQRETIGKVLRSYDWSMA
jgi:hypothetical protein